jgi:hypothetical protein
MKKLMFCAIMMLGVAGLNAVARQVPNLKELNKMASRFVPVKIKVDISKLSTEDKNALGKIVKAARILDKLFLIQYWRGNLHLQEELLQDKTPLGKARLRYFNINMAPWSALDEQAVFIPDVPPKHPEGSNFYPEDMTKAEFETWVAKLPTNEANSAKGFFTVIRRGSDHSLNIVPFSKEYRADVLQVADFLARAAMDTKNESLKKYLSLRAKAFLNDNYYESDVAWMDLDAPLDITVGPYETYNDGLFGYKASFESFITLRDDAETAKLNFFAGRLQEVEDHLPIDSKYRNPKLAGSSPIRVVNQILATGDANHGVRTAAFNLPNDEAVIHEKGSKRVMLKNIQQAKFDHILIPISKKVLSRSAQKDLSFDSFFTHILAHELSHGIGPHKIKVNGKDTDPRQELKEVFGALEEAKADITGLFMLQYLFDHNDGNRLKNGEKAERELYTTFLASGFRTLRFGMHEAHGKGMAMQINYIVDKGGFRINPKDGTFDVDFTKIKQAVSDLTHDLLTLEATGDYAGAKKLLDEKGVVGPALMRALGKLKDIPTDIEPINVTADKF